MQKSLASRVPKLLAAFAVALSTLVWAAQAAGAAPKGTSWAFSTLRVPAERPSGRGALVAVVDSGIDSGHPAFAGRVAASVDCVGSAGDPNECSRSGSDDNGHGTHIAGIIAARRVGGGPEGVSPGASLLAVRALRNECDGPGGECRALGDVNDVVAGVRLAVERRADVINLSIDAGVDLDWEHGALAAAVADAWESGAVVVASAGNRAAPIDDPALSDVPLVLVGATTAEGVVADYSNVPRSARWSLFAPGGDVAGACPSEGILSTYPRAIEAAGRGCLSGTSMSAAYVSGALASLIGSGMEPHAALAHLLATAAPSADGAGDVPDLTRALSTPPQPVPDAFSPPAETDSAGSDDALTAVVSGRAIEAWAADHPVRARAAITTAGLAVMAGLATRRRPAPRVHA